MIFSLNFTNPHLPHLQSMDPHHIPKADLNYKLKGKTDRGRQIRTLIEKRTGLNP